MTTWDEETKTTGSLWMQSDRDQVDKKEKLNCYPYFFNDKKFRERGDNLIPELGHTKVSLRTYKGGL